MKLIMLNKEARKVGKMKALEHLMPVDNRINANTHLATHSAHQIWIAKIDAVWKRLHRYKHEEIVRIQNDVRKNKMLINQLSRDNLFELDVNAHE